MWEYLDVDITLNVSSAAESIKWSKLNDSHEELTNAAHSTRQSSYSKTFQSGWFTAYKAKKKIMYYLLSFINLNTYLHANNCMISS